MTKIGSTGAPVSGLPHTLTRRPLPAAVLAALLASSAGAQLVTAGNHRLFQPDVGGVEEAGDHFGAVLAAGDFDGDGYRDLAIGAPEEDIGAVVDAGAVFVAYGAAAGLGQGGRPPDLIHQDVALVQDVAEAGDRFGGALAVGDFNGDGFDDLAVGVPGEGFEIDLGGGSAIIYAQAGAIHTFPGGPGGLVAGADGFLHGGHFEEDFTYTYELDGAFGAALASCGRNGDGYDDLIVGAPGVPGSVVHVGGGRVLELLGSANGLTAVDAGLLLATSLDQDDYQLGAALGCGDLDGEGGEDVVIGSPGADFGGAMSGYYALRATGSSLIQVLGVQPNALLGSAVAFGRFEGSGQPGQMLVGEPGWDSSGQEESGRIRLHDHASSVAAFYSQSTPGIGGAAEPFDHFGEVLAAGDFDRDGFDDAVVGVPGENLGDLATERLDAGIVHVLYGSPAGPIGAGSQLWTWDAIGFGALANDHFGGALAVGDFDGDGVEDLAIGAPNATWTEDQSGIVQVLYARPPAWIFGDGFETGDTRRWDGP